MLLATTRPRSFITKVATLRESTGIESHARGAAASFVDTERWLERYDSGEFCFDAAGHGGGDLKGFYGEAAVPARYVENVWGQRFSTVGMVTTEERPELDQNVMFGVR